MIINDHKTTKSQGPRTINLCDDFIELLKDFPNRYFVTNEKFELYKDPSGLSKKMKKVSLIYKLYNEKSKEFN